jgi:hypothetical protein
MFYALLLTAVNEGSGGTGSPIAGVAMTVVIIAVVVLVRRNRKKKRQAHIKEIEQRGASVIAYAEQIRRGELPHATGAPLVPKDGEAVHFTAGAVRFMTKNRVVGRTSGTSGASFRIAKGVTIRKGGYSGHSIYGDVTSTYNGTLTVTNRRIIFTSAHNSFDVGLGSVLAVAGDDNGRTVIQTEKETYVLLPAVVMDGDNAHVLLPDATDVLATLVARVHNGHI